VNISNLPDPVIESHKQLTVVRDDLLDGGSKTRFLPFLIPDGCQEMVFGGPFCGGAPWALSVVGRELGIKVTLFYAKRKTLHWRQEAALKNGATIYQVPAGRMAVVQHRARTYCQNTGAYFFPLGFDLPEAEEPFIQAMLRVGERMSVPPPEVWCATGSGMLARCLSQAFPQAQIKAVAVGLASRWKKQQFRPNVEMITCNYKFEESCERKVESPFPSCGHYDRKAWEIAVQRAAPGSLFWNVAGALLLTVSLWAVLEKLLLPPFALLGS
jgi:hypothetical protein